MRTALSILGCLLMLAAVSVVQADEDEDPRFRLYKKGREWKYAFFSGDEQTESTVEYKVTSTSGNVCKVKKTEIMVDENGKKSTDRETYKFTMEEQYAESWIAPPDTAKRQGQEVIEVKAGKFACYKYLDDGWTKYYSAVFPGLLVRSMKKGWQTKELIEFEDEKDDPAKDAFPGQPASDDTPAPDRPAGERIGGGREVGAREPILPGKFDFRLYKDKGREWVTVTHQKRDDEWIKRYTIECEVLEVEDRSASLRKETRFERGQGSDSEETIAIKFDYSGAKHVQVTKSSGTHYFVFPDLTIEVEAGVFDCHVVYSYSDSGGRKSSHAVWYYSKTYPGLLVYMDGWHNRQELTKFDRDRGDKEPDKADYEEIPGWDDYALPDEPGAKEADTTPDPAELNWDLYRKKGRTWMTKRTAKVAGQDQVSYTKYEVTESGDDYCKLKSQALKADKTPAFGPGNEQRIDFTEDNAFWVAPMENQKQVREETIEAAGQEWECIVYEDTTSVKGVTMTSWMSKKYPGLWVKMTSKGKYNDSTTELVEFKD